MGVHTFDDRRAAGHIAQFVYDNPVVMDYYDNITVNPRVVTMLVASLHDVLVPERIREERRRVDYINKVLKQKKSGKMPARLYDDFMRVYFSGTVDTNDLKPGIENDFNSLALKRASGIFNR